MRIRLGKWLFAGLLLLPASAFSSDDGDWQVVESPHFTVVTDVSRDAAREVALKLEEIRVIFSKALPEGLKPQPGTKLDVFAVTEGSLEELLPQYGRGRGESMPAGLFVRRPTRASCCFRRTPGVRILTSSSTTNTSTRS